MLYNNRSQIRRVISRDRLDGYFREIKHRQGSCNLLDALTYYSWNALLSESFYVSLQTLEVSLRNSIQTAANKHFGNPLWFEDQSILKDSEIKNINSAKKNLKRQRKNIDSGRIVSELHFGFWTSLFYARYETILWRPLIKPVFPKLDRQRWNRKKLSGRFDKIRKFRNRIFHYEPVWYYNLQEIHSEIIESIFWIEPSMLELLKLIDPFPKCCSQERFDEFKISFKKIF